MKKYQYSRNVADMKRWLAFKNIKPLVVKKNDDFSFEVIIYRSDLVKIPFNESPKTIFQMDLMVCLVFSYEQTLKYFEHRKMERSKNTAFTPFNMEKYQWKKDLVVTRRQKYSSLWLYNDEHYAFDSVTEKLIKISKIKWLSLYK